MPSTTGDEVQLTADRSSTDEAFRPRVKGTKMRYDAVIDTNVANNSHTMSINAVGVGKRVLDVGCATGYLAEFLAVERQCDVWALEPDPQSAAVAMERLGDRVKLGGTERLGEFPPGSFDVVVYADVLEHLVDPGEALRESRRLLAPGGYVVAVIPNGAHGDVRLHLLTGQFQYRRTGLLDSTHLRFLTRHSIPELFFRSGYQVIDMMSTQVPLGHTELGVDLGAFSPDVLATVHADPDHSAYQYVVCAGPLESGHVFTARTGWMEGDLVRRWAEAFSSAEPVVLVLPVPDDEDAVNRAVAVIEGQCAAAGTSAETVADIELVRTEGDVQNTEWSVVDATWSVSDLRAAALPVVDALVA
jgi:ubiquinone/menaquinone biosynthesis C-methylase UbiE